MPRTPRMLITGSPTAYHVISRTTLPGLPIGEPEKEHLLKLMKHLARLYFVEVLGFCILGSHFHLMIRMLPESTFSDEEVGQRIRLHTGAKEEEEITPETIAAYRERWQNLSSFVKDLKQGFSRWYNKRHDHKGTFWTERFKSVIAENGDTVINCLAYIDLNPVRAGIVKRPEDYRWCSLAYHLQTGNRDGFLSLDFGLRHLVGEDDRARLRAYRAFLYSVGADPSSKGAAIGQDLLQAEEKKGFEPTRIDRFRCRTRYFSDSAAIGTRAFVADVFREFDHLFPARKDKKPHPVSGLDGIYSLRRLRLNP